MKDIKIDFSEKVNIVMFDVIILKYYYNGKMSLYIIFFK